MLVVKRDGRTVLCNRDKLALSVWKLFGSIDESKKFADKVLEALGNVDSVTSSKISEVVKSMLPKEYAEEYKLTEKERELARERNSSVFGKIRKIIGSSAATNDELRENANINGDCTMGKMLAIGSEGVKNYVLKEVLPPHIAKAHINGDIHIHDLNFFAMTINCLQIDLASLFEKGFSTGYGTIRPPQTIRNYFSLACIVIQSNQNDCYGGQAIPSIDYCIAPGVAKTYARILAELVIDAHELGDKDVAIPKEFRKRAMETVYKKHNSLLTPEAKNDLAALCMEMYGFQPNTYQWKIALERTVDETMQGAETLVHNLCTMSSRAGAQVPFSSLSLGTAVSQEGRMVTSCILQAVDNGLGNSELAVYPIVIFKVKEGVNFNPEDINYDLFLKAVKVSSRRMYPTWLFLDAPYNLKYYKQGDPDTEVSCMGCRTRVMGNVNGPETTARRGNLSYCSINLPRLGIESNHDVDLFFKKLDEVVDLVIEELLFRFQIQCSKRKYNYPFMFGNNGYMGSENLTNKDNLYEALKNGTLSIAFIGLAECLTALIGKHHGESQEAQELGLKIIGHLRDRSDQATEHYHLNFSLFATPAEGLSGRFTAIDRKKYGIIKGVTDKDFYTNSSHIPVNFEISAARKLELEGPYHAMCNAGCIAYVEFDGDATKNTDAMVSIIRKMRKENINYGAINVAADYDPICHYFGIIGDTCPRCGRRDGELPSPEMIEKLGLTIE